MRLQQFRIVFASLALWSAGAAIAAAQTVLVGGYLNSQTDVSGSVNTYNSATGLAGSGLVAPGAGGLFGNSGLTVQGNTLYVASQFTDQILRYDATTGAVQAPFINFASGYGPGTIKFDASGNAIVTRFVNQFDSGNGRVDVFNSAGTFVNTIASGLTQPTATLVLPNGNILISEYGAGNILRYNGSTVSTFAASGSNGLTGPQGSTLGSDGNVYVANTLSGAILRYTQAGAYIDDFIPATGALSGQFPSDLIFDGAGRLVVSTLGTDFTGPNGRVYRFDATTGAFIDFAGSYPAASSLALQPVPEPASLLLASSALVGGLVAYRRRRRHAAK